MFTSEDIQELSRIFGITPVKEKFQVRDGSVTEDDKVWWHGEWGPELVSLDNDHKRNIKEYPQVYSIEEPRYRVIYEYQEGF